MKLDLFLMLEKMLCEKAFVLLHYLKLPTPIYLFNELLKMKLEKEVDQGKKGICRD